MHTDLLKELLLEAAPSGHEARATQRWRAEAQTFADQVSQDSYGNVYAELNPPPVGTPGSTAPSRPIALMAHLDEIGLMVTHVADDGIISFAGIGWWDPQVLVGQRVRLLAEGGDIIGVVGKVAIHLMNEADKLRASTLAGLWIDTTLIPEDARRRLPTGTVGVLEQPPLEQDGHLIARALDNRAGAFIVLEVLRELKARRVTRHVVAVATVEEELGFFGAQVSGYRLNPAAAIVVDGLHDTGQPGVGDSRYGRVRFGSGANLAVGSRLDARLLGQLKRAADEHGIPYSLSARPERSDTDADGLALARAGIPTALVSLPLRNVHTPSEMVRLSDVQACIDLLVAWVCALPEGAPPVPDLELWPSEEPGEERSHADPGERS